MKENSLPPLEDDNPMSTWVATPLQTKILVGALEENGFKKLQIDGKSPRIWNNEYEWYYDESGNVVTVDFSIKKTDVIITFTLGCKPIVSDAFGGMDKLRKATDRDF